MTKSLKYNTLFILLWHFVLPYQIQIQLSNLNTTNLLTDLTNTTSDYNLCQIFPPPLTSANITGENQSNIVFTEAFPNKDVSQTVRFIVLHKCRWSSNQDLLYSKFLNESYECGSTDFVQVLQTCHEEVLFMWSKGAKSDSLPAGYGFDLSNNYILMMIILEDFENSSSITKSEFQPGLLLNYSDDPSVKLVQRTMIGQQTSGKHILLSNQNDWITTGICSGHCTSNTYENTINTNQSYTSNIIGINAYTRSLGTMVSIDVNYSNGTKQDLPLLRPTFLQNHQLIQHFHSNSSFKLYPGDDIILNCHHNSSSFKYPIFGGISASEEICLVLLTHYCPKNEDESCPLSKIKSCISWPTDETLAKVFNFELDFYEQYNRFSNKRVRRKTYMSDDLFLTTPTIDGNSVLSYIYEFDQNATIKEKYDANMALLNGEYVSECSDSFGSIMTSILKRNYRKPRKMIRHQNLKFDKNGSGSVQFTLVLLMLLFLYSLIK